MIAACTRRLIPTLLAACLLAFGTAPLASPQVAAAYDPPPVPAPAPGAPPAALPEARPAARPAALTPPALDDVTAIAAGGSASCALTQAGAVYCWGLTLPPGQPGFSDTRAVPAPVQFGGAAVASISVGWYHACAVTAAGGARCWGNNDYGLGGALQSSPVPLEVTGLAGGVAAIGAGAVHSCALTTAGGVKCWGGNYWGQLGDGTTTDHRTPVDVAGLTTGVQAISVGYSSTCALTAGGEVKCWGRNVDGQLGDGTYTDRTTPVLVAGLSGVTAIAVGGTNNDSLFTGHACALVAVPGAAGGDLKCWGRNVDGELGDGTTAANRSTPVSVVGFAPGEIQAVTAGDGFTCALTTAGAAKCWGRNVDGQLGDGTTAARPAPVPVGGLSSGVQALAAGELHACAIVGAGPAAGSSPPLGRVQCWGAGDSRLGNYMLAYYRPTVVPAAGSDVQAVAAGPFNTCVLRGSNPDAGDAWCWGDNYWGQLGDGTRASRVIPAPVLGLDGRVKAISLGDQHSCAVVAGAGPGETIGVCWGGNLDGQLGDGTTVESLLPVAVQGLGSSVFAVSAGATHTCALVGDAGTGGGVKCWGSNVWAQLGDHTDISRLLPVDVVGLSTGVRAVAAADEYTCALTTGGGVKCWGRGIEGQLGDGASKTRSLPVDVKGLTSGVTAIAASTTSGRTCALTAAGAVKCWGERVGPEPVDMTGLSIGVQALEVEKFGICAILLGGDVACLDDTAGGPLGDGHPITGMTPERIRGLAGPVRAVALGNSYVCAVTGSSLQCWGSPILGALGLTNGWLPVDVITPATWVYIPQVRLAQWPYAR